MITVFHRGDAPDTFAELRQLGIAFTEYDLRRNVAEASWAAHMHLRDIGRARDVGDGVYEVLTPTTTIDNALGRAIIAGDDPAEILARLPDIERRPAGAAHGVHARQADGTCSCKTDDRVRAVRAEAAHAPVCPECRQGKHGNCDGTALDEILDDIVACTCPPAFGHDPRPVQP